MYNAPESDQANVVPMTWRSGIPQYISLDVNLIVSRNVFLKLSRESTCVPRLLKSQIRILDLLFGIPWGKSGINLNPWIAIPRSIISGTMWHFWPQVAHGRDWSLEILLFRLNEIKVELYATIANVFG